MEQKDYRLAAIMYTDIAGFSRMMEKDEAGTLELLRFHNDLLGGIVREHHGTVIKTIGDALLVDFKNTVEAMQSALEIQDRLYAHNKENPQLPLLVRIGVHLGDIYFFENDALGEGINIAARLQSLASPGCICFSQDVYNLVLNKIEFRAEKLGKVSLKNITKEIHAYEITTPNAEFDPNRDKPRPGYKPGSYLGNGAGQGEDAADLAASGGPASGNAAESAPETLVSHAPSQPTTFIPQASSAREIPVPINVPAVPAAPKAPAAAGPDAAGTPAEPSSGERRFETGAADRSYSPEGSRRILDEIRKAILQDIKTEGRRLTVQEAIARYGSYGVEAKEVIASMVETGLLVRGDKPREDSYSGPFAGPGGSGFDPEALGRNIEAAVHGFVAEFEKNVSRGDYGRRGERHERRDARRELREQIRTMKDELPTGKWDAKLAENETWNTSAQERVSTMESYRNEVVNRARHQRGGLIGNLSSYVAVNAGLWYLNLSTGGPHPYLWAGIVSLAWGIGLVSNFVAVMRGAKKAEEVQAMPDLDEGQLRSYKKLNRVKDSMAMHAASSVTVPLLLAFINLSYTGGLGFLWFLIPTAAMAVSLISHWGSYGIAKSKLEREITSSLGVEGGWRNIFRMRKAQKATSSELGPFASLYQDAERAKAAILAEIKNTDTGAADLAPNLDAYVGQVRLLAQSANEIDRIVGAIPMEDLSRDKEALVAKAKASSSTSLREEYQRSIDEIDKQEKSYEDLRNQSEVIKLRLSSSVNQLKQMRIDMARLKAAGEDGSGGVNELKRRTSELSAYLQDLRKGYEDGTKDPFAELEEAERQREERRKLEGGGPAGPDSQA